MTQGYVTDDGTFFESKLEAELHEAEARLRMQLGHLTAFPNLNADAFLAVVLEVRTQLRTYIDAHQAIQIVERDQQAEDTNGGASTNSEAPKVDPSTGHISGTEEELASLLKLPTRGHSDVPNVGSRSRAKKIPDRRKVDGA